MLTALAGLVGLASFVVFVVVIVKQFQIAGPVHGIVGIVTCGLWTFIWGWIHSGRHGLRNLMLLWTALIVVGIALQVLGFGAMMAQFR
jgi:hypothetical protein